MSMFTVVISCLTTSSLPWFMDLTFQIPMQYCCLQHRTLLLSPVPSTAGYCFCFGSIPSFFLELLGTYGPGEFLFQCPIILPSHTVHGVLKARTLKWLPFPSPVDHTLSDLCTMTVHLGWPYMTWLILTALDTAVVLWSDWLVFCDRGFSVSALWCPLATPAVFLGFLLPWTWAISSRLLQHIAAAAPDLGRGASTHGSPSWPWTWSSSSRPSCARGSSSWAGPLTPGVG